MKIHCLLHVSVILGMLFLPELIWIGSAAHASDSPFQFHLRQVRCELSASYVNEHEGMPPVLSSKARTSILVSTTLTAAPGHVIMQTEGFKVSEISVDQLGSLVPQAQFARTYDVHHWSMSNQKMDYGKQVSGMAVLPLHLIREIHVLRMTGLVKYAVGEPEEIRLSPLADYLGRTIHVENIPGLALQVTRKPAPRSTNMEYTVSVKYSHRHHVYRVMFLDEKGAVIEHQGGAWEQMEVQKPASELDVRILQVPTERACHAVVFEVFPLLRQKELAATFEGIELYPRKEQAEMEPLELETSEKIDG